MRALACALALLVTTTLYAQSRTARQPGVWELHQTEILVVGALIVLQSAFIAVLLLQRSRRRRIETRSDAIFRALPDLMFLQSMDGTYLDYHAPNPSGLLMPSEQFLGKNMRNVLPPELLDQIRPAFARACASREPVVVDYDLEMPEGCRRYEARLVRSGDKHVLTLVRDVTEHKRIESALRDSAHRYALASAAGSVGVWDWNFQTNELFVDPSLKSILGFEDSEITSSPQDWGSRVHPQDVPIAAAKVTACIEGDSDVYEVEHRMLHKDGSVRWFLSRGSAIRGADGAIFRLVGTKVDITERKRAEESIRDSEAALEASYREIQHLAGALITAQDVERARIARDLHDDVSQQLAALSISLSGLKRRVEATSYNQDLQAAISSIQDRAVRVAESIRSLSHDLHPDVLKHGGLSAALTAHCDAVSQAGAIALTCTTQGNFESIDSEIALCVYRIAQEALHNVVKHAHALQVEVKLARTVEGVELSIADDGRGFDVGEVWKRGKGLGLVSINERVRLAGGVLSVVTEREKGTQVRVLLPLISPAAIASGDAHKRYAAT